MQVDKIIMIKEFTGIDAAHTASMVMAASACVADAAGNPPEFCLCMCLSRQQSARACTPAVLRDAWMQAEEQAKALFNASHRPEKYKPPAEDWGYGLLVRLP